MTDNTYSMEETVLSYFWSGLFIVATIISILSVYAINKILPIGKFIVVYFTRVNKKSTDFENGGDVVAQVLKAHDVRYVFTICGGHISPILVGCEKRGIRVVDTRHEVTSVFAADAVARITGTVGVAIVTAGPGATNTVTAVKNAQMAQSPLLILSGAAAILFAGRGSLQDIDQLSLFSSICKHTASIKTIKEIVPTMRNAIKIAKSGTPGPVFVEFPIDTLYPYDLLLQEIVSKNPAKSFHAKMIEMAATVQIDYIFAGAFSPQPFTPLPTLYPEHSSSQIVTSVNMILQAKQPLIVIASQALLHSVSHQQLKDSLESIGIPCYLSGMSRGLLGAKNKILLRHKRRDALKESDLIILAGAVCDFRLSYGKDLPKQAKKIAINRCKEDLYRNTDVIWKPNLSILGDAAKYLVSLSQSLAATSFTADPNWITRLKERDEQRENENLLKSLSPVDKFINPLKILFDVRDLMDENSIIVVDGGDFVGTASYILRPNGALTWLDPGPFGTLGVGGGFALGAKLSCPESEIWIIYGDGSVAYSIAEFDTFVRHKVPVIALVGNDACWGQIARSQIKIFDSAVACNLLFTNYEDVAKSYGGVGFKLDTYEEENIRFVLTEAKKIAKQGLPVLINVLIGKSDFRDGSISV